MESLHLEVFKKTNRRGTLQCGLLGMVVFGRRLDLLILDILSSFNDSIILFYDSYV